MFKLVCLVVILVTSNTLMNHCLSNTCYIYQSKVRVKCCAHTAGLSMSDQTAWPWPWSDWFDMCLTDSIKYLRSQDSLMYMRLELVLSETGWRNFALYSYLWRGGTSNDTFDVYQMIHWTTTLYNVNSLSWHQNNTYNDGHCAIPTSDGAIF